MNIIAALLITASLAAPAFAADERAPQLPPIDAGSILAQIEQRDHFQPPQPIISTDMQFALEAASELRKELKGYGIKAKVGLVNEPKGGYGLWVEFRSWQEYELVKDMFYQDPGANPSYMGHKVYPRVPKSADRSVAEKKVKACWLKAMEKDTCVYKCNDGTAYTQPMQRPLPWNDEPVIACPQLVFPF